MTHASSTPGRVAAGPLSVVFDPRRNSLDVLRLTLAVVVAATHGTVILAGWQPHWGSTTIGAFAVDGFFVLSGFLVARSFVGLGSVGRFAWHRFLRIMPGFWACLVVTAFMAAPVAAVLRGGSPAAPFSGPSSAWSYLTANAGLFIGQYPIGDLLAGRPSTAFNGALWTLVFEAFCYGVVAVLGVLGLLRRRGAVLALTAVLAVLTLAKEIGLPVADGDMSGRLLRLLLVFLLGVVAYLYAERIPMRGGLATVAAVALLVSPLVVDDYRVLGAVPLTYVLLWFATCSPWHTSLRTDLSYGMYIYHFPVFQLLALTSLGSLPTWSFVPFGLLATLAPAALSWYLVERPALAHKNSGLPDRLVGALLR